jgi:nitrilase
VTDTPFTVASVQASPVFLDRKATVEKACGLIAGAAKNGAKVIVFPEVFVPGYPDWVHVLPGASPIHAAMYAELLEQSVTIPGPETDRLCKAAKAAGAYVVIGMDERNVEASGSSIYNTLLYIDDSGTILGKHRKLVPTAAERLIWAAGDGSTLEVFDTPYGRLGGLICWENYMPLARYAMYAAGTQIYVAATWDSSETWVSTLQHIAKEGRCVVIGSCIATKLDDIPDHLPYKSHYPSDAGPWINSGRSAIVVPDRIVAGPAVDEETILYAEIDPSRMRGARFSLDVAGHYARPDVFQFSVNREPRPMMTADSSASTNRATQGNVAKRARPNT